MGSKGRMPPPHLRRPFPGAGLLHPDPFGSDVRPPPGGFPFETLPPEIMDQKFAAQQMDMHRLLTENQRIAATHSTLRQELGAAQQELQRLQTHMGALKSNQEQEMRVVLDKIAKMEADLQASETIKMELQQARAEAQSLMSGRQDLYSKILQLNQDLHRSHGDVQQLPALMSELESLRQEYQHCRATYDYDKKLRIDHSEQLQVLEKNYVSMVREVETLRTELAKASNPDRSGVPYASNAGYKENVTTHQPAGKNVYEDGYGGSQGRGPSGGVTQYGGSPAGLAPARAAYDAPRGAAAYDASRNPNYDPSRVSGYDNSKPPTYEAPRGGSGYDAASRGGTGGTQPIPAAGNTAAPYGSSMAQPSYGSAQAPNPYGSAQAAASPYGSAHAPPPYGTSSQAPSAAGGGGGGGYEGSRGGNAGNVPPRR